MAVLAITEYSERPTSPSQWQRYYDVSDDKVYIQILPIPNDNAVKITVPAAAATRVDKIVTIDFSTDHYFSVGDIVIVSGMDDSSFDGEFEIIEVPDSDNIIYAQNDSDAVSGNGDVEPSYPKWVEITTGRELREDVRVNDSLVKAKYSGKDYQTFLDEGLSWLKENYGDRFNTFIDSDPAIMHAKYTAAAQDELSWYQDLEATEFFWKYMRIKRRAYEKARRIGYIPRSSVACSVDVSIELTEGPYSFDVTLGKQTHRFQGPNDLVFELQQEHLTFFAGETSKSNISLSQIITKEVSYVSNGEANQQFILSDVEDDEYIAKNTVKVYVGGIEWDVKDSFDFEKSNQVEIWYGSQRVVVGNGVIGNIPEENSEVLIQYGVTKGVKGKLALAGTIDSLVDNLVVNFNEIPLTISNTYGASGGSDDESLDEIIVNAPKYFDTALRGTTAGDLTTLTNIFSDASVGSVAKGKASIIRGIGEDLFLVQKIDDIQDSSNNITSNLSGILSSISEIDSSRADIISLINSITSSKSDFDTNKDFVQNYLLSAESYLSKAKSATEGVEFREVLTHGDGSTSSWSGVNSLSVSRLPIKKNSVFIWVDDYEEEDSGSDGDCDSSSGSMSAASASFAGREGRLIKIGNQLRKIVRVISGTEIEYSGSVISGTGINWILYKNSVSGSDDGDGNIVGNGITSGTIDYNTGDIELTLGYAPSGEADYGSNILISYGYYNNEIDSYLDNLEDEIDNAESSLSDAVSDVDEIETSVSGIYDEINEIKAEAIDIISYVDILSEIPSEISSEILVLKNYLDENLSDECRANIVRVQALVKNIDGFYAAPSQTLLTALEESLQEKAVAPTTIVAVSGYYYIVAINMEVEIKVSKPYSYLTVLPNVQDSIDELLKDRDYGQSLYRSQYYNKVVPDNDGNNGVTGVGYANIKITSTSFPDDANTGTPPSVDSDGNLIIDEKYIITKGTITYSEVV